MSKKSIKSDVARVDRLTEKTIDYADIPALDEEFLSRAVLVPWPPTKVAREGVPDADQPDPAGSDGEPAAPPGIATTALRSGDP